MTCDSRKPEGKSVLGRQLQLHAERVVLLTRERRREQAFKEPYNHNGSVPEKYGRRWQREGPALAHLNGRISFVLK